MQTEPVAPGENFDTTVNTFATLQDQLLGMGEGIVRALPNMAIALVIRIIT